MPAEQIKSPRTLAGGPGGLPDMFNPGEPDGLCTVASGPYGEQLPVALTDAAAIGIEEAREDQ